MDVLARADRRVRVGIIGAGNWGINHVRVVASEPRCELVAVCDRDASRRDQAAKLAPNARWASDAEALLAMADVDAVIIATPARTHVELALAAFAAGKHVLVEKPLAMSVEAAERVAAAAARAGTVAMVGHVMVFHPAVRRIRSLLRSGELGELYYLHATRVNLGRLRRDETALWCFGPHDLSMIDYIVGGQPAVVSASGQALLQRDIEDVVFVTLTYPSGQMAHLHLSWLHPRKERRLTLVCSQKMVDFDDQAGDKLRICDKGYDPSPAFTQFAEFLTVRDGDVFIPQLPMEEPLRAEIRHFAECVQTGSQPETDLASGVRVTAILDAAERSLRQGGTPIKT